MINAILDGIPVEMQIEIEDDYDSDYGPIVRGTWAITAFGRWLSDELLWNYGAGTDKWYKDQLIAAASERLKSIIPEKRTKLESKIEEELRQTRGSEPIPDGKDKNIRGPITTKDIKDE